MNKRRLVVASVLLLLVPVLCVSVLGYWVVSRVKQEARLFREDTLRKLAFSAELNSYQAESYARLLMMAEAVSPEKREAYHVEGMHYRDKIDQVLKDYAAIITPDQVETRRDFDAFVEQRKQFREVGHRVRLLIEANQAEAARELIDLELVAAYRRYTTAGDLLFEHDLADGEQRARQIESVCATTQFFTVCICVGAFFVGVMTPVVLVLIEGSNSREPIFS
jgi:hypothetical protein